MIPMFQLQLPGSHLDYSCFIKQCFLSFIKKNNTKKEPLYISKKKLYKSYKIVLGKEGFFKKAYMFIRYIVVKCSKNSKLFARQTKCKFKRFFLRKQNGLAFI